jgi:DNA-binding LacI/PurR family transcriptional regulator
MKRTTMADVAALAGVSKTTVSFVLNERPGLKAETKAKVLAAIEELGWTPSATARTLSGKLTDTVGVVLNRPPRLSGIEPTLNDYYMGVERGLSHREVSMLTRVVNSHEAELLTLRTWWHGGRVDGTILHDLRAGDDRPGLLASLGMPVVGVGDLTWRDQLPVAWSDDAAAIDQVVGYLYALGHRRIARLCDRPILSYSRIRTDAFTAACARRGLGESRVVEVPSLPATAAQATRELLLSAERPSALFYENTVTAMAGLAVAGEMGIAVPRQLSVVAWGSAQLCDYTHPTLSAVEENGMAVGVRAAELLLDVITGREPGDGQCPTPAFTPRGSTAPWTAA